jgi:hypothetical protein
MVILDEAIDINIDTLSRTRTGTGTGTGDGVSMTNNQGRKLRRVEWRVRE